MFLHESSYNTVSGGPAVLIRTCTASSDTDVITALSYSLTLTAYPSSAVPIVHTGPPNDASMAIVRLPTGHNFHHLYKVASINFFWKLFPAIIEIAWSFTIANVKHL